MYFRYQFGQQTAEVTLERSGEGFRALVGGVAYAVEVLDRQPGEISLRFNGRPLTFYWAQDGSRKWLSQGGCTYWLDPPAQRASQLGSEVDGSTAIRAPMPAQVRAVQVAPGDPVQRGQVLLLLEAMKMEIQVKSPAAGRVNRLLAAAGQTVDRDQLLVEIGE
ncbi:MAG: acetyl-CoA carboxylase biotin carboxyl carrier protein subunit [Bellilinea sp.]